MLKFLVTTLFFSFILGNTLAQTADPPSAGDGSAGNPYQIATINNLYWLSQQENNSDAAGPYWTRHYIQTADIDASATTSWDDGNGGTPEGFIPIGNSATPFTGTYDGNNHSVTGLYINRTSKSYIGLFGQARGATLKNLSLNNADVTGYYNTGILAGFALDSALVLNCNSSGLVKGYDQTGGLIGEIYDSSNVENSFSTAVVSGDKGSGYSTGSQVGGLIGQNYASYVTNCYAEGNVTGDYYVGGLVGDNAYGAHIINSKSKGDVTGDDDYIGGLTGSNRHGSFVEKCFCTGSVSGYGYTGGLCGEENGSEISNCFARGNVQGSSDYAGGAVGYIYDSKIENTYSTGSANTTGSYSGGFIGYFDSFDSGLKITNSFWNTETSGNSTASDVGSVSGATGLTITQMQTKSTFSTAGWDFINIWAIDPAKNDGYPYLPQQPSTTPVENTKTIPSNFFLSQNYPNPFNPSTQIKFGVPKNGIVSLKIYDILGREITTLVDGYRKAGNYRISFNASALASGIYFYKITTGNFTETKKMILMK